MSKVNKQPIHHEYKEDEIDIFKLLHVLLDKWKILVVVGILGLIIGVIISLNIAKKYTAETKVKLFKQTLNQLAEDKDTNFHVLKLEDKVFVQNFKDQFRKQQNWDEEELDKAMMGLRSSDDRKKAPGIVFLKASSTNGDTSNAYLDFVSSKYVDFLQNDLKDVQNIKIGELEERKKEYFQKLKEFEKELTKFDSGKILKYECEDQLKSDKELENAFEEYKDIVKQRELLEHILPGLKKASPAEICDAFKTTCSDLADFDRLENKRVSLISNSDRELSVIVSYREKENRLESLKSALKQAQAEKAGSNKIKEIKTKLTEAEIDLNAFAKVTLNQLEARKNLLKKQETALLKKIEGIKKFQQNTQTELIKYNEIKNRYNSLKKNFQLVADKLTEEKDLPEVKYYCEVINQPKITKTNTMKRFSPVVIIPLLLVGLTAFLLIFVKAYKEHNEA